MRLRNKKTGEIKDFALVVANSSVDDMTLAELNEEWEDYEEPKEAWAIGEFGELYEVSGLPLNRIEKLKEIGNYFETKEEAEKAVERLRAWKRLKDKGFNIYSWDYEFDMIDKPSQTIILRASAVDSSNTDLDLLFGGEE